MATHMRREEMWIESRAIINEGWIPLPRHAESGRHAGKRSSLVADVLMTVRYALRSLSLTGRERAHAWHADTASNRTV